MRLELDKTDDAILKLTYFNSIKVRLELIILFQLQGDGVIFQFHKGAIRTVMGAGNDIIDFNFNSIKVRLEPHQSQPSAAYLRFQFHKGAIRT